MKSEDLAGSGVALRVDGAPEPVASSDSRIRYVVNRCRGKSVLDLGCVMHDPGEHRNRFWLHRAIVEVADEAVGLDLHKAGVHALNAIGYNVVVGDAEDFSFDRQFDVIVVGDLIEHLSNPGGMLESCLKVLKPGGMIIIQTPNPWYWRLFIKAILFREVENNPEHTCWFDPRTLRQLAQRYGLALDQIEFQSRFLRDRLMPLPRGLKHTSWSAELRRASEGTA